MTRREFLKIYLYVGFDDTDIVSSCIALSMESRYVTSGLLTPLFFFFCF